MPELDGYRDRGARALILLHDHHLRPFPMGWPRAAAAGVVQRTVVELDARADACPDGGATHPIRPAMQLQELMGEAG